MKYPKVAIIGTGKTGGRVKELYPQSEIVATFNSKNPLNEKTVEELKKTQVAIVFVTGDVFSQMVPFLIESKVSVVCGVTGIDIEIYQKEVEENNISWIYGSNFSLGMNLTQILLEQVRKGLKLFESVDLKIHEVHHIHKKDAPSGTALTWKEILGDEYPLEITHAREGDAKGFHKLKVNLPGEEIELSHCAFNRDIFAQGAIWAARYLASHSVPAGITQFRTIMKDELYES